MGHNVSDRKRLSSIMAIGIADLTDSTLAIYWPLCRRSVDLRVRDLIEIHGTLKLDDVVPRLRYARPRCGPRPDQVIPERPQESGHADRPGCLRLTAGRIRRTL
jgi:hypothetical protein